MKMRKMFVFLACMFLVVGSATLVMTVEGTSDEFRASEFNDVAEEEDDEIALEFLDEGGEPIDGIEVDVIVEEDYFEETNITDGEGKVTFDMPSESGSMEVQVSHEDDEDGYAVFFVDEDEYEAGGSYSYTVSVLEEVGFEFNVEDEDGEPIEGANITMEGQYGLREYNKYTDEDGYESFEAWEGEYDVTISKFDYYDYDITDVEGEYVHNATLEREEFQFDLNIFDEEGESIEDAEVRLEGEDVVITDDEGYVWYEDMYRGDYEIEVCADGYEDFEGVLEVRGEYDEYELQFNITLEDEKFYEVSEHESASIEFDFGEDGDLYDSVNIESDTTDSWFSGERTSTNIDVSDVEGEGVFTFGVTHNNDSIDFSDVGGWRSDVLITVDYDGGLEIVGSTFSTDSFDIEFDEDEEVFIIEAEDLGDIDEINIYTNPSIWDNIRLRISSVNIGLVFEGAVYKER